MSGQFSRAKRMASCPLAASPATSNPSCCRSSRTPCRTISWSSARRMRVGILTRVLLAQEREEIRKAPQIGPGKSLRACRSIEERHGFAGVLRALGGLGGHVGAPHFLDQGVLDRGVEVAGTDRL